MDFDEITQVQPWLDFCLDVDVDPSEPQRYIGSAAVFLWRLWFNVCGTWFVTGRGRDCLNPTKHRARSIVDVELPAWSATPRRFYGLTTLSTFVDK